MSVHYALAANHGSYSLTGRSMGFAFARVLFPDTGIYGVQSVIDANIYVSSFFTPGGIEISIPETPTVKVGPDMNDMRVPWEQGDSDATG